MLSELSIVIPTLNEENYLPTLLTDLSRQKFDGKLQVIVVDGESTDRTIPVAQKFVKQLADLTILQTKKGVSHQRNTGAEKAKYDHIIFMDADIHLKPDFLDALSKKVSADELIIASTFQWMYGNNVIDTVVLCLAYVVIFSMMLFNPLTPGALILVSKSIHQKIHGFTEGVILGEDIDYGKRAHKAGATYHFFFGPIAYQSLRRVRKKGRWALLWLWFQGTVYTIRHGAITDKSKFQYEFGHYDS